MDRLDPESLPERDTKISLDPPRVLPSLSDRVAQDGFVSLLLILSTMLWTNECPGISVRSLEAEWLGEMFGAGSDGVKTR